MSLLIPLGLLGLLSLILLLLIYLLKPNYQQKVISSTYVWKLSLRYKKKKIPISRLRNLLILLCQILILCSCAMILTKPVFVTGTNDNYDEKILVIDASADMLSNYEDMTRFERAVEKAEAEATDILNRGGFVSVITAGNKAEFKVRRADSAAREEVTSAFASLSCSYGEADVDGAMGLAEDILAQHPNAETVFFTGTHYSNPGKNVRVEYVSMEGEWNAAILSAKAELVDNNYVFTVEVANYGSDKTLEIYCDLTGCNDRTDIVSLPVATVNTHSGETKTIVYSMKEVFAGSGNTEYIYLGEEGIYTFEEAFFHIDEADSIALDNEYYVYSANRPEIKIMYYTKKRAPFYSSILSAYLADKRLASRWDLSINEIREGEPELEGYDFYFFEEYAPECLPTDGVVFLANPDSAADAGFTLGAVKDIPSWEGDGAKLSPGVEHEITKYIGASMISVTQYTQVDEDSLDGYDVLLYYEGNPVFFVRNDINSKIAVVTFGTARSTFNVNYVFPTLMRCLFDFYFPSTYSSSVYNVYDTVDFTARGTALNVTFGGEILVDEEGSEGRLTLTAPGTYTVKQHLMNGTEQTEKFYAVIPFGESDITRTEDALKNPHVEKTDLFTYDDLLLYFAIAVVALLFLERLLYAKGGA